MSDNSNDPELLNLGVEADTNPLNSAVDESKAHIDALTQAVENLNTASAGTEQIVSNVEQIGQIAVEGATKFDTVTESIQSSQQAAASLDETLNKISADLVSMPESYLAQLGNGPDLNEPAPEDGSGSGGRSGGSAYGAARGLGSLGSLISGAGAPELGGAFTTAAQLVRVEHGLGEVGKLLTGLNETIETTPGLLAPLVTGLTAMEVPMAGLLAIALPLTVAAIAVIAAIKLVSDELNRQAEAEKRALATIDAYYKAIEQGTTESIQSQIAELEIKKKINDDELAAVTVRAQKSLGITDGNVFELLRAGISSLGGAAKEDVEKLNDLTKTSHTYSDQLKGLKEAQDSTTVATNDLIAAENELADERLNSAKEGIRNDVQDETDIRNGSTDSIKTHIQQINDEIAATQRAIDSGRLNDVQIMELQGNIDVLRSRADELTKSVLPLAQATKDAADALKYQEDQMKKVADIQEKYDKQKEDITKQEADKEIQIRQQAWQKAIDLTQNELDAIANKREQLAQQELELEDKFGQDSDKEARKWAFDDLKAQQKEAEDEQTLWINHLRKLKEIQESNQNEQRQDLLNRDYLALAKIKANNTDKETAENEHYTQQKEDIERKFEEEKQVAQQQRAFERQERIATFNQRIKDIDAQAEFEIQRIEEQTDAKLALNNQAAQREIDIAIKTRDDKLTVLADEYTNTLKLATRSRDDLLSIEADKQQRLINLAESYLRSIGVGYSIGENVENQTGLGTSDEASGIRGYATGGDFAANMPFVMSEGGSSERINIAGQSYSVNGAALVYPLQSGSVTPSGGKGDVNATFNIYGAESPQQSAQAIRVEMTKLLKEVMG